MASSREANQFLKRSASFRKAALTRMGKGKRSARTGNLTIASHCSPSFEERRPVCECMCVCVHV